MCYGGERVMRMRVVHGMCVMRMRVHVMWDGFDASGFVGGLLSKKVVATTVCRLVAIGRSPV